MSNASYMAGVIITICIVAAIIITIIAMMLSRKVDELENRLEGLAEAINRKTAMMNTRIDDLHLKLARVVGWIEGLMGRTIKGVEVK